MADLEGQWFYPVPGDPWLPSFLIVQWGSTTATFFFPLATLVRCNFFQAVKVLEKINFGSSNKARPSVLCASYLFLERC